MPGFTIHIAIAKEYARKHKGEIRNIDEFIEGTIAPDYIPIENKNISKSMTHYGYWGDWTRDDQKIYLEAFLKDSKVDLGIDYWKGYFIHLLADDYFDRIYFRQEAVKAKENNQTFHRDYDCLNAKIVEKYKIKTIEKIQKYMQCIAEKPRYLDMDKILKFIEDISNMNLKEQEIFIKQKCKRID